MPREPSQIIRNAGLLSFPQAVTFSGCGSVFAVAYQENHTISTYDRTPDNQNAFANEPRCLIRGSKSGILFPAGLAFHPECSWLVVASHGSGPKISIFRCHKQSGRIEIASTPASGISEDALLTNGLAVPHDFVIAVDGRHLIGIHERFYKNSSSAGESGVSAFECDGDLPIGQPEPVKVKTLGSACLHSVGADPTGRYLAITNGRDMVDVYDGFGTRNTRALVHSIRTCRGFGLSGVKGVAYTADGGALVVTTELNQVLLYESLQTLFNACS